MLLDLISHLVQVHSIDWKQDGYRRGEGTFAIILTVKITALRSFETSALGVMPHNTCVFISTAVRTQILRTSGYFVLTLPEFETRLFGDCSEGRTSPVVAHGT
jgi:hypothetical protein